MRDIFIPIIFILIYVLGLLTGMKYYENTHPIPEQKIYTTYEVIDKEELNIGLYKYTLISKPFFDSIKVVLEDDLNIGYDKLNLTK